MKTIEEVTVMNIKEHKKTDRPRGTDGARVISVIETTALEGRGTEDDPARIQKRYWSMSGELLAEGSSGRGDLAISDR